MTDPMPNRPFTALPPPPDGLVTAVREGRRIRRRRRAAGTGAAALSLAVVAGAVVVAGGTSTGAQDQLVPAERPTATPTASAPGPAPRASAPATVTRPGGAVGARPAPAGSRAPAPTLLPRRPSPSPSPVYAVPADPGGYRTPEVVRRYVPPSTGGAPAGRICSGGGDSRDGFATGYCVSAYAPETSRGHELVLEICRDSTGPGRLRFPRELELDLVVHDPSDKDRVVWQWAAGRSNDQDPHTLSLETGGCWTWTASWTDVDRRGRPLEIGPYELAAVGFATETRNNPAGRVAFDVD